MPTIRRASLKLKRRNRVHAQLAVSIAAVAARPEFVAAMVVSVIAVPKIRSPAQPDAALTKQPRIRQNKALAQSAHPSRHPKD